MDASAGPANARHQVPETTTRRLHPRSPGSGGGDLQPSHWRRIVAPRFKSFKARWCGVQRQAAAATRGGSAFTVGGAGRRHSGAPILRRYATRSAWLLSMANLSAVQPSLQPGSEWNIASAPRAAAPVPRGDVCFRRHQHTACLRKAPVSSQYQGSVLTEKQIN